nr:MipA/OmpV family protein [Neptunicella marina]
MLVCSHVASACDSAKADCIEPNSWQFSLAVGAGVKLNPLHDSDNIPLVILPDIAWYGESAYFDNGELGYQWTPANKQSVETFVRFNSERAYFSFWHPANLLLISTSDIQASLTSPVEKFDREAVSYKDVRKRDWAVDAGIRWQHQNKSGLWQVSVLNDISNTYNGQQLDLKYKHNWQVSQWNFTTTLSALWKSSKLLDYYYGLNELDNVEKSQLYHANSGWFPGISILARHPISENWQWVLRASYQHLPSAMSDSPLVERNSVASAFIGAAYRF